MEKSMENLRVKCLKCNAGSFVLQMVHGVRYSLCFLSSKGGLVADWCIHCM